jgi:hypothetical protein
MTWDGQYYLLQQDHAFRNDRQVTPPSPLGTQQAVYCRLDFKPNARWQSGPGAARLHGGIGVQRESDVAVTEQLHHDARRNALDEQERRTQVSQAVKVQRWESGRHKKGLGLTIQPAAVQRLSVTSVHRYRDQEKCLQPVQPEQHGSRSALCGLHHWQPAR